MSEIPVIPIERTELALVQRAWPFAEQYRAEIAARFAELQRQKPAVWNGRVLVMGEHRLDASVLQGSLFATDYASFRSWIDWGCPEAGIRDLFALGALWTADGAFILGVMGPHTANAGRIYFPSGTPDPSDVVGTIVDLEGNVRREVAEETGLSEADYLAERGWYAVLEGPRIACMKLMRVPDSAAVIQERILDFLAREREPELSGIRIVRSRADFDPMMPAYVTAFLEHFWARNGS